MAEAFLGRTDRVKLSCPWCLLRRTAFLAAWSMLPAVLSFAPAAHGAELRGERIDPGGAWCGARALWLIARANGLPHEFDEIRVLCDDAPDASGVLSLAQLADAAVQLGFSARVVRCESSWLAESGLLAITPHSFHASAADAGGDVPRVYHCLIVVGHDEGAFLVVDPHRASVVQRLSEEAFEATWSGSALLIAKQPSDLPLLFGRVSVSLAVALGTFAALLGAFLYRRRATTSHALVVAIVAVGGCAYEPESVPQTGGLAFDETTLTHPPVLRGGEEATIAEGAFRFVNRADYPITISEVKDGCGCDRIRFPRDPIHPGEEGTVTLFANVSERSGRLSLAALVVTDEGPEHATQLTLETFVVLPPFLRRGDGDFGTVPLQDGETVRDLTIALPLMPDEAPPPATVEIEGEHFSCRLVGEPTIETFGRYSQYRRAVYPVICSVSPNDLGEDVEGQLLATFEGRPAALAVPLRAAFSHPLFSAGARVIHFGNVRQEGVEREIIVASTVPLGSASEVSVSVESADEPGVSVYLERLEEGNKQLVLRVVAEPEGSAFFSGTIGLTLETRPEIPPYRISLVGYRQ